MDFTIPASDLTRAVTRAKGIALNRAPSVITNNLHISASEGRARFTAFDGTVAIITEVAAETTVPGACLMPYDASAFLLTLTGQVHLSTKQASSYTSLVVSMHEDAPVQLARKGGKEKSKKGTTSGTELKLGLVHKPEAFAKLPDADVDLVPVPAATLRELLVLALHAASADETRHTLCTVFLHAVGKDQVRAVATDGHRLFYVQRAVPGLELKRPVLLPTAAVEKLVEVLSEDVSEGWHLGIGADLVVLEKGEVRVLSRTVDGAFPEYERTVPKMVRPAVVPRVALLEMVKRVGILGEQAVVRLALASDGQLLVTATHLNVGNAKDALALTYSGPECGGLFALKALTDALKAMGDVEEVSLQLPTEDEVQPLLMRPSGDASRAAVIMPRRA